MPPTLKNRLPWINEEGGNEPGTLSLAEAKDRFLQDIRGLAYHTQRWHRENITALEKILAKQDITVLDCRELTVRFRKALRVLRDRRHGLENVYH